MCHETGPPTCRTTEAVAALSWYRRPGRLIELHLVDLPVRHASSAKEEGQRDGTADGQQLGRPDVNVAEAAGLPVPSCLAAAKSSSSAMRRGE
jgi:hypothetical protein